MLEEGQGWIGEEVVLLGPQAPGVHRESLEICWTPALCHDYYFFYHREGANLQG